jgi:hypothetical protein
VLEASPKARVHLGCVMPAKCQFGIESASASLVRGILQNIANVRLWVYVISRAAQLLDTTSPAVEWTSVSSSIANQRSIRFRTLVGVERECPMLALSGHDDDAG